VTITFNTAQAIVHVSPFGFLPGESTGLESLGFLAQAAVALQSAMACRVFRQIRIGLIADFDSTLKDPTSLRFAQRISPLPGTILMDEQPHNLEASRRRPTDADMRRTTESREDREYEV
jgi:hypothetical protein